MRYTLPNVLHDGILTNGRMVKRLEAEMAAYHNVAHAVALSSCTAGLMLLIQYFARGGTVVMPSFTFRATADAAYWNNCHIQFTDIGFDCTADWGEVDADLAVGVHTFGNICDEPDANIPIIYDAAHCVGMKNFPIGKAAVLSLSPTKAITALEGGVVLTNDSEVAEHISKGRNYGESLPGLSARMSELHAMTALAQMGELTDIFNRRKMLMSVYRENLPSSVEVVGGYKDFPVLVDDAHKMWNDLLTAGIDTKRYFKPVHHLPHYKSEQNLPKTEDYHKRLICLPMHNHMTTDEVEDVCREIKLILEGTRCLTS